MVEESMLVEEKMAEGMSKWRGRRVSGRKWVEIWGALVEPSPIVIDLLELEVRMMSDE
jgi:hypothetical protein